MYCVTDTTLHKADISRLSPSLAVVHYLLPVFVQGLRPKTMRRYSHLHLNERMLYVHGVSIVKNCTNGFTLMTLLLNYINKTSIITFKISLYIASIE